MNLKEQNYLTKLLEKYSKKNTNLIIFNNMNHYKDFVRLYFNDNCWSIAIL